MKERLDRIYAILLMDYYYSIRNLETFVDVGLFPAINVLVFGFLSVYLTNSTADSQLGSYVLMGGILWEIFRIAQYTVSIDIMWNIWSRNLTNIMMSPITTTELFVGSALASFLKAFVVTSFLSVVTLLFGFNIFEVGIVNLLGIFINLSLFAVTLGILLMGFIFRYGTRMQAIAWGVVFLFQPISATIFPLEYLPEPMQKLAVIFPTTHMFEMARAAYTDHQLHAQEIGIAFLLNIFWGVLFIWGFNILYRNSRKTGQFARNEG